MSGVTLKIKAWNKELNLMTRIDKIDCKRGKLYKKGHILFLFTGTHDKNDIEIYDGDILLYHKNKYAVSWDDNQGHWVRTLVSGADKIAIWLSQEDAKKSLRLCHSLESSNEGDLVSGFTD